MATPVPGRLGWHSRDPRLIMGGFRAPVIVHTPSGFEPSLNLPAIVPGDTHAFAFRGDKVLAVVRADESLELPTYGELSRVGVAGAAHFLGMLGQTCCLAVNLAEDAAEPAGMRFIGLRALFFKVPEPLLALAARALPGRRLGSKPSLLRALRHRLRAIARGSGPRNARPAGSSPTRGCRRR